MTKGKELGAGSAICPIPLPRSSAHGPTGRSSLSPPGTACPGIQSWRETCVHQGTKLSSPALCSLPQPRAEKGHKAASPSNLPLGQDCPQPWTRPGVALPSQSCLTVRMGTPFPEGWSLGCTALLGSVFSLDLTGPWSVAASPLLLDNPAQFLLLLPQQPLAFSSFSISLLSQLLLLLISMCTLGFQHVQIPLG